MEAAVAAFCYLPCTLLYSPLIEQRRSLRAVYIWTKRWLLISNMIFKLLQSVSYDRPITRKGYRCEALWCERSSGQRRELRDVKTILPEYWSNNWRVPKSIPTFGSFRCFYVGKSFRAQSRPRVDEFSSFALLRPSGRRNLCFIVYRKGNSGRVWSEFLANCS